VIDLLKRKKANEIVRCGFSKQGTIVCCKKIDAAPLAIMLKPSACEGVKPVAPVRLDDHIVNGEEAEVAEFPHMAAIGYETASSSYEFNCGGTLISDNFVLTAAHCVNRRDTQPAIVRLGKESLLNTSSKARDLIFRFFFLDFSVTLRPKRC
jgi:secreted trypsin-like serine protease